MSVYSVLKVPNEKIMEIAMSDNEKVIEIDGELKDQIITNAVKAKKNDSKIADDLAKGYGTEIILTMFETVLNPVLGLTGSIYGIQKLADGLFRLGKGIVNKDLMKYAKYNIYYRPENKHRDVAPEFMLIHQDFDPKKDTIKGKEDYAFFVDKCPFCGGGISDIENRKATGSLPAFCVNCGKPTIYQLNQQTRKSRAYGKPFPILMA